MRLVYLLILFSLVLPVYAADIQYYEISSEVSIDGSSVNYLSFLLAPKTTNLEFTILATVSSFSYQTNFEGLSCNTETNILGTQVKCSGLVEDGDNRVVKFVYETVSYTKGDRRNGIFNANYRIPLPADSVSVAIKLPEGFVLAQDESLPQFSPSDGVITSDGRRIITQWFRRDVQANNDLVFSVIYEDKRPEPIADLSRVVVSSFILLILFGIVMYIVLKGKQKERTETILEVLTADEKNVINKIKENGGSVIQKKIVDSTDYSKAKISRIIKDLKQRGIITVEPQGRENLLTLTKKIKK